MNELVIIWWIGSVSIRQPRLRPTDLEMVDDGIRFALFIHGFQKDSVTFVSSSNRRFDGIEQFPCIVEHINDDVVVDTDCTHYLLEAQKADLLLSDEGEISRS